MDCFCFMIIRMLSHYIKKTREHSSDIFIRGNQKLSELRGLFSIKHPFATKISGLRPLSLYFLHHKH